MEPFRQGIISFRIGAGLEGVSMNAAERMLAARELLVMALELLVPVAEAEADKLIDLLADLPFPKSTRGLPAARIRRQ